MTKLIQKMKRNSVYDGEICANCLHAVSSHNIEIETRSPLRLARLHSCNTCGSKKCDWQ